MPVPSPQRPESADGLTMELRGGLEAAAAAHQALIAGDEAISPEPCDAVLLLMMQAGANAVRHCAVGPEQMLDLDARWRQRWVRVEVTDPGSASSPRVTASPNQWRSGGWCLFLVEHIVERWRVRRTSTTISASALATLRWSAPVPVDT